MWSVEGFDEPESIPFLYPSSTRSARDTFWYQSFWGVIISLKLELSSKVINHKLYGFKIYQNISNIVRDAVFKYSLSATQSLNDAARFLGMSKHNFKRLYKKYNNI